MRPWILSASDRPGLNVSDFVLVSRHSETALAVASKNGDCDMPKYIVPP